MEYTLSQLFSLFFIYSLAGWLLDTAAATIFRREWINKGYLSLPLCPIYGVQAVAFTLFLSELKNRPFFLFLGGMILAAFFTLITAHILERLFHQKWWDYRRFQFEGYLSLPAMASCGLGAVVCVRWGNPLFLRLISHIPEGILRILLMVLGVLLVLDFFGSSFMVWQMRRRIRRLASAVPLSDIPGELPKSRHLLGRLLERRLLHAYPNLQLDQYPDLTVPAKERFAQGCCFYKLVWLFLLGSLLGDFTETIFCRLTAGVWMSRSSLVYGPFSIVWGFGCVIFTAFLYRCHDKSDRYIFIAGTVLGGAYEYVCSVLSELLFGTIFWDYSHIPFNLGGRINLLYCFFWGIAAVVWLKGLYPPLSALVERIPKRIGPSVTWLLILFMVFNMAMSGLALARYTERQTVASPSAGALAHYLDSHFPDERMERIYPNAKLVE